jgi:tetraprenyl-beta-curcumene synthase
MAALRYWLTVLPVARRELRNLRQLADRIPDRTLRRLALGVYESDWASLEGVAAFAAFTSPDRRAHVARLLIRLQSIYQYTDTLMEQPSDSPAANASQLHAAVVAALRPEGPPHIDYYAYTTHHDDGGYLVDLVDRCRGMLCELPHYLEISGAAIGQAQRIVFYQSRVNLAERRDHPALACWAQVEAPTETAQRWWELAAACGSSLPTLALIAAAADPSLTERGAHTIEALYWPWMGALHTLLDSLIDRVEDASTGQHNLLDHYPSPREMANRMEYLTIEALRRADAVGIEHRLILAGVISLYLSDPQAWVPYARDTTERVLAALGGLASPAMLVLRARRLAHRPGRSTKASRHLSAFGYPLGD